MKLIAVAAWVNLCFHADSRPLPLTTYRLLREGGL